MITANTDVAVDMLLPSRLAHSFLTISLGRRQRCDPHLIEAEISTEKLTSLRPCS